VYSVQATVARPAPAERPRDPSGADAAIPPRLRALLERLAGATQAALAAEADAFLETAAFADTGAVFRAGLPLAAAHAVRDLIAPGLRASHLATHVRKTRAGADVVVTFF